ncbi:HAD-IB family hydrolase [Telmatospirillum siberiense]|uniref:HAD-IB family hydrolase n=1 Tax=Telmatospirillum siberiense TaxID=382514 RepID=A0A2N3PMV9_9PROT|nr:HAD-IB family hydrolase [Telmatospirillum siberiense]
MAAIVAERAYAFFDVDNTLIDAVSMFSFQAYWYRKTGERDAQAAFDGEIAALRRQGAPREFINRRYYAHFAGREVVRVERCAEEWFGHLERSRPDLYHDAVIAELRGHQAAGREAVLVSGSFPALLARLASRLGVRHLLATSMEVEDGRYTGRIFDPQTIGAGKATAIGRFLERMQAPAGACYAYGDHSSDLPMLQAVGHPNVVRGDPALEAYAQTAGWRILAAR